MSENYAGVTGELEIRLKEMIEENINVNQISGELSGWASKNDVSVSALDELLNILDSFKEKH